MAHTPPIFTPEELARYSRQLILPGLGRAGQAKLREARVLLIGLGGLGSPAALYLAAAGVGTLGLAEHDRVEPSNLHRQILHDTAAVGTTKLASARARLTALNPHVVLREHPEGLTAAGALALFSSYDIIVDGADNFPTRYLASDAAVRASRPLVHGSIFQYEGQVTVLDAAHGGPCYRCLFPAMPAPGTVPNCAEAGVFGALCGIIGSLMAMEALKLILGEGETLCGRLLVFDALAATPRVVRVKRDPHCPCCGAAPDSRIARLDPGLYQSACETAPPAPTMATLPDLLNPPMEIDVPTAHAWLASANAPLLLDVREPFEVEICRIPGSVTIPLGEVPDRLADLPRDRAIVIHCHHGGRSLQAAKFLRAKGFLRTTSMLGGIAGWAEKFDPGMGRY
jgi:sulfur-carrier protein adenylyltransferase/sulfurtransferase